MKTILAILAVVVVVQALEGEQKAKFDAAYNKCVKDTAVDEALIKRMRQNDFVIDAKLKEYVSCMFKAFGFTNEKGEIQLDAIKAKLPAGVNKVEADKVIDTCKDKQGDVVKDIPFNVYQCFRKTDAIHIVF